MCHPVFSLQARNALRFAVGCALFTVAAAFLVPSAAAYPPAGRDAFDSMAIVRVAVPSLGFPETPLTAVGPARIRRGDPYDPGDGRIKIDVEIEEMVLSGDTPLGPAVLRVITPAPGCVQQKEPGVDFPANSWFDVKVEIIVQSPIGPITVFSDPDTPVRMMAMIDDAVGEIIASLKASGLYENTVICFNADHGDYLGDFNMLLKGAMPFRSIRVFISRSGKLYSF